MDPTRTNYELLSELIRKRMEERGITLTQLAKELQWPTQLTHLYVRGVRRAPSPRYAQLLDFLGIENAEIPVLTEEPKPSVGKKVFISYSHKDKDYLTRLMVHLRPLEKQQLIDPWVDTRLIAGDKWKKEIEKALKDAKVAILLISADFLASDFIIENELPPLLHSAEQKGTIIIPLIIKPCRFTRDKNLREFQSINSPEEPLALLSEEEREVVYDTVAQRIESEFGK